MIGFINIGKLRNNDYSQFLRNVLKALARFDPSALGIEMQFNNLQAISETIKSLLNEGMGNAITDELINLDNRRDEALNGLLSIVNGFTYSDDDELKKAANMLSVHLSAFGPALARESYQNETSKIEKIILDWNTMPELSDAIKALGLERWKTALEKANTAFDDRYVDRSVERGIVTIDKVSGKRPEANKAYNQLRDRLNAWLVIKEMAEPYATAVAAVNGVVSDYNDLLAGRGSQAPKEAPVQTAEPSV